MDYVLAKYKSDPDLVVTPTGYKFIGPKGEENLEQHEKRLAHNQRMRFNRSVHGLGLPKKYTPGDSIVTLKYPLVGGL